MKKATEKEIKRRKLWDDEHPGLCWDDDAEEVRRLAVDTLWRSGNPSLSVAFGKLWKISRLPDYFAPITPKEKIDSV